MVSWKSMVTSSAAGVLAAILMSTTLVPSAHAVDAEDLVIYGHNVVGYAFSVEGAYDYFAACDSSLQPSYDIQWLRNGLPVDPAPEYSRALYDLDIEDVGSRISAVVTGSSDCTPSQIVVERSDVVMKQPMRAGGFTGRDVFELLARRPDGVLMLYPGQDTKQGWNPVLRIGPDWGPYTRIIPAGDLTSDGLGDLLTTDGAGRLWLARNNGDGWISPRNFWSEVGWGWNIMDKVIGPGDFDGDGYNDLLATEPNGDLYLYSKAARGWTPRVHVGQGWNVMDLLITPGDFNGDGTADILAKDKAGKLFLYGGDGRGGWTTAREIGQGWNVLTNVGSVGDFNRDGVNDVHGVNSAGDLVMYYGDGRGGWKGVETVGRLWNVFNGLY